MSIKYNRIVLKISGEALAGAKGFGLDDKIIEQFVSELMEVKKLGVQIGLVVGGGNFWRGRQGKNMDRTTADHMGMLATVINALALQDAMEAKGIETRVQTALTITRVAEPYILRKALNHLDKGRVVIFACGTGNPYFSTDTAAALRSAEIGAQVLLSAKNIDGIYTGDPKTDTKAVKIDRISYMEFINRELKAMDATAVQICMENKIPVIAFGLKEKGAMLKIIKGEKIGTIID